MKRLLICTTALVSLMAASASAEWNVTFTGNGKFEAGARKLTGNNKQNYPLTANQDSGAFFSSSKAAVNVTNKLDDVTYGASIRLQVATNQSNGTDRESRMDRSHLFMDSSMGSVQLGTNIAASKMMKVDAGTIAAATGGVDGDYNKFIGTARNEAFGINSAATSSTTVNGTTYNGSQVGDFPIFSQFAITGVDTLSNRFDGTSESSDKITYISPRVEGVQFGVSFTPDMSNGGNSVTAKTLYESNPAYLTYGNTVRLKNIWSLGLNYMNTFNDVNVELGLTGDFGSSTAQRFNNYTTYTAGTTTPAEISTGTTGTGNSVNAHNLRSYTAGLMLEKNGFSAVVSYANDGNSAVPYTMYIDQNVANQQTAEGVSNLTPTLATGKFKSNWWTAGLGYANGPMSTSLTYLDGQRGFSNAMLKTKALSLGADYEVIAGFKPFAEVTYAKFSPSGAISVVPSGMKATTFILGTRVKF